MLNNPITESQIPAPIARDSEYLAGDLAHLNATDPHLQYAMQGRGDARYLRTDVIPPLYGGLTVPGSKNGYAGLYFSAGFNGPTFMVNTGAYQNGLFTPAGWQWQYNNGWLRVFNPTPPASGQTARGVYIGLEKGFGSLPGYPQDDYPVLRTDFTTLYFSIGNVYSAHITTAGTYVSVSDKEKKKQAVEVDYSSLLKKIKDLPIYEYSFLDESDKIRRVGPYAQDFYKAFGLGGELDETGSSPDKMLAPTDVIGVLLAALKALAAEVDLLKSQSLKK